MSEKKIVVLGQLYSAKNSMQIVTRKSDGRQFIVKSAKAKQAEKGIYKQLETQMETWYQMTDGLFYPLGIRFKMYRESHARFDFVNLAQSILDQMVAVKYIEDDNMKCVIPIFDYYEVDKLKPRTEITVVGAGSTIVLQTPQAGLFDTPSID